MPDGQKEWVQQASQQKVLWNRDKSLYEWTVISYRVCSISVIHHDNCTTCMVIDHRPEVNDCVGQRSLCEDKCIALFVTLSYNTKTPSTLYNCERKLPPPCWSHQQCTLMDQSDSNRRSVDKSHWATAALNYNLNENWKISPYWWNIWGCKQITTGRKSSNISCTAFKNAAINQKITLLLQSQTWLLVTVISK